MNSKKLTINANGYPEMLREISEPPETVFVTGDLPELLARPRVGIVGSRKVSPYGRAVTEQLAGDLARQGIVIVSGLALGVDALAHRAALDVGGLTLAVLPGPLEKAYPATNQGLAQKILGQRGALVSEYPVGTNIMRHNFIARNRIIAGLSDVLLITEAALKSGSLHTARFALEQGRDVVAVPGNIDSVTSVGTNNLLKAGAGVVTSANDVLTALGMTPTDQTARQKGDNEAEQTLLDLLQSGVQDGTELLDKSALDIDLFNQTLTMLEITGKIQAQGNNKWSIKL